MKYFLLPEERWSTLRNEIKPADKNSGWSVKPARPIEIGKKPYFISTHGGVFLVIFFVGKIYSSDLIVSQTSTPDNDKFPTGVTSVHRVDDRENYNSYSIQGLVYLGVLLCW